MYKRCGDETTKGFLLPAIFHYMKNLLTRYQLAVELCSSCCGTSGEDTAAKTAIATAEEAFYYETKPYISLVNSLLMSPEELYEQMLNRENDPSSLLVEQNEAPTTPRVLAELLKITVASEGNSLEIENSFYFLPISFCEYIFAPLASLIQPLCSSDGKDVLYLGASECPERPTVFLYKEGRLGPEKEKLVLRSASSYPAVSCRVEKRSEGERFELTVGKTKKGALH